MQIDTVILHNFRSVKDMSFNLDNYNLLVGENNAGKTGILTALRCFYEDQGAKFNKETDFPKFQVDDNESWIEIYYKTTEAEQETLKDEYCSPDKILRIRKYFLSDNKDLVKSNQSNIYGYENGVLAQSLFYGAKNISQAKLGSLLYIPEVNKTEDTLKLSGPSPFRDMLNFVMKRAVSESDSFTDLKTAFDTFNQCFKGECSKDGFSVNALVDEINKEVEGWRIRFGVDVNPVKPEEIVKNLLTHYIEDENLEGKRVKISTYGQGLQRHLIYTLIRLSSKFAAPRSVKKKDFAPDFILILFEEPEAFLHPSQQDRLNASLHDLASEEYQQILITTHSPNFVSKNVQDLTSIVRIQKPVAVSDCYQLSKEDLNILLDENIGLYRVFCDMLQDPELPDPMKTKIKKKGLGEDDPQEDKKLEEEAIRCMMWLNTERATLFFAKHVIICEGPSEKVLFEYLIENKWPEVRDKHVYFADALGKFSIHRFMTLLSKLGINHSVLIDRDKDEDIHKIVNEFIEGKRTEYTNQIKSFDKDLEEFLGIPKAPRRDLKPIHVLSKLRAGEISEEKIAELRGLVDEMLRV